MLVYSLEILYLLTLNMISNDVETKDGMNKGW